MLRRREVRQRDLGRRARQVPSQHVDVVGVDQRVLVRPAKQLSRMAHEILVQRVVQPDQHRKRRFAAATCAPCLLPKAGDRTRVSYEQRGIQSTHVDPKLQRVSCGHPQQFAAKQIALDLPALLRRVAGAVGGDARGVIRNT